MTRVLLIHAGPTKWDTENRVAGGHSLPLTADARIAAQSLVDALAGPVDAIYFSETNEACNDVADMLAEKFSLRPRDKPELAEMRLGLWEGLTRDELGRRFETVYPKWLSEPLAVNPPDGESLSEAIERIRPAVRKLLRRSRGGVIALVLRPLALQIVDGLLRGEEAEVIAAHLHGVEVMETIELQDAMIEKIVTSS